jgi:hypothetical protein
VASNAIERAKETLRIANENLNRQMQLLNRQRETYNVNIANAKNTVQAALQNVNSNQMMLKNLKLRFGREFIINGNGNYYYDGKDFYDSFTNKKMGAHEAKELQLKLDSSLKQLKLAQLQTQNLMQKWF